MTQLKNIRELRIGRPKTYKTGAVVNTYPKPMLVFEGDEGGLSIATQPVAWIKSYEEMLAACKTKREHQPAPISAWQFANTTAKLFDAYGPIPRRGAMAEFNKFGNLLFQVQEQPFPWKTVVLDPATELTELILGDFCVAEPNKMKDARKWAYPVGLKVAQTIQAFFTLPCHVVVIMHTSQEKEVNDEGQVKRIYEEPVIYSKVRDFLGHLPDQYIYSDLRVIGGRREATVDILPTARMAGLGMRWPTHSKDKIGADFASIYGEAVKKGETWE